MGRDIGDIIDFAGYDIVASAVVAIGGGPVEEIKILNNNSDHYIVVEVWIGNVGQGKVKHLFRYDGSENSAVVAYACALTRLLQLVLEY